MAGRDLLAPVEQIAVEERRAVLDREVHGVEVVLVEDDGDALVEQLVEHAVAQQGRGVEQLSERLGPRPDQHGREALRVEIDVIARERPPDEVVGILQERVAHDRRDVGAPLGQRGGVPRRIGIGHRREVGNVVVVVAGEQLVGAGAADRDLVAGRLHGLHQHPVHVVGDGVHRRVVIAHQLAQVGQEVRRVDGNLGVAHAELAHHQLHHVPLLVARVGVHDGEAVHVVAKLALGDRDQRRRIDAARQQKASGTSARRRSSTERVSRSCVPATASS